MGALDLRAMPRMKSGNHESLVQLVRDLGGRAGCDLVGMDLDQLLPLGADPAQNAFHTGPYRKFTPPKDSQADPQPAFVRSRARQSR